MQPYLFPYLGYFQMIQAADRFVFLDDVNFIKRGWINRNRVLCSGEAHYFTVPLASASQNLRINTISIAPDDGWKKKLDQTIRQSYAKSPHFSQVYELISPVLFGKETLISEMAKQSVAAVTDYLGVTADFIWSSADYGNQQMKGEERILDICAQEGATVYYNLPGGQDLYDEARFASRGISLQFLRPGIVAYRQFSSPFQSHLSIIDVLMFNDRQAVLGMLGSHS